MFALITVIIGYSLIWLIGLYAVQKRLHSIQKRTAKRIKDYDNEYHLPVFRKPGILSILLGIVVYIITIIVIITFLKP